MSKLRQWALKGRIVEILNGEPQPGAQAFFDALSDLSDTTYGFGVNAVDHTRTAMLVSTVGQRETGMVRLRIDYPDYNQATHVSLPVPDSIPEDKARIEFFRGAPIGHPTTIDPRWACEIAWAQLVIVEQQAALAGMSDSDQRRILADPLIDALQLRWYSEFREVATARQGVAQAHAQLWHAFRDKLSKAGCIPERAFETPREYRLHFEQIEAPWAGRRAELIRTAHQLDAALRTAR